jgi:hypothetical protein
MLELREKIPIPARTLWLVRGWERERCYHNPIGLLNETLAEHGRDAYEFLLAEIFRVLKKRFGIACGKSVHILVRPGFSFWPCEAVRPNEDSIQMEGNSIIHPLLKEAANA